MKKHFFTFALAMMLAFSGFFASSVSATASNFNQTDINVINAMIQNNSLNWSPSTGGNIPTDWAVTWSPGTTGRQITRLDLSNMGLTGNLDLRNLSQLDRLDVSHNQLTALNVTGLSQLRTLIINDNRLTSLDLRGLRNLTRADVFNNNMLNESDVSGTAAITRLTLNFWPQLAHDAPEAPRAMVDESSDVTLSPTSLDFVQGQASAIRVVQNAVATLINNNDRESIERGFVELFAENATARAAHIQATGNSITINHETVSAAATTALNTRNALQQIINENNAGSGRPVKANVSFIVNEEGPVTITIESTVIGLNIDNVLIRMPTHEVKIPFSFIRSSVTAANPLVITLDRSDSTFLTAGHNVGALAVGSPVRSYTVNFSRPVTEPIQLQVLPTPGDTGVQTFTNSNNELVAAKFNPITGLLSSAIMHSDTFLLIRNPVDFSDIDNVSEEMQHAIRAMAAQGLMYGVDANEPGVVMQQFRPNDPITRAEFASTITKSMGLYDPMANGNFSDVPSQHRFVGAIGSATRHRLMTGISATEFNPDANIQRQQLVAIVARVLREQMGYTNPPAPHLYLTAFTDYLDIENWALTDVSLAVREGLTLPRADNRFLPSDTITRGEAALILYRMYNKLW
ncbi:MAG: S-layer homology domain-containing protein [Firmicutes bacterium]|nr:S-layer homology domain-containing protein [Bacillota bacterium]